MTLEQLLGTWFSVFRLSPWTLGWPVRRPRKYTVLLLRDAFKWAGSAEEFEAIYARQVMIGAEVLFCAPQEDLEQEWVRQAAHQMKLPSDGSLLDLMKLLTPGHRRRALLRQVLARRSVGRRAGLG